MRKYNLYMVAIGLLLCVLSAPAWANESQGPFSKSCLSGRYVMATTGWDVSAYPGAVGTNIPLSLAAYVNFVCTGTDHGTFTGQFVITIPTEDAPTPCNVGTGNKGAGYPGTFTIDPTSGAIKMSAGLSDVSGAPACSDAIPKPFISESGYLSDPSAMQLYEVETSPQATSGDDGAGDISSGVVIHYLWTKQGLQQQPPPPH